MAIRVVTGLGNETRAISIRATIGLGNETRAISIREAISTTETREILAPPVVVLGPFGRLIANSTMITAAHFTTHAADQNRKYRRIPDNPANDVGSTIAEFQAPGANVLIPLIRGFEVNTGGNLNLRQFGGNNTPNGIDVVDAAWSAWDSANGRDSSSIYVIDITVEEFMVFPANAHNNDGGSYVNYSAANVYTNRQQNGGTFTSESDWTSYVASVRNATTPHEMIVAICNDETFVPTF